MSYRLHVKSTVATRGILRFILVASICLLSTAGQGDELLATRQAQTIPEEVEVYSRELNIISNNPNANKGVEGLLQLGRKASDALVRSLSPGKADILESLSEDEFQAVVLKMKGFSVNRQETVFVEPDPNFFIALAKRSGDQASVDFFEVYRKTKFAYFRQQTDYNGCYLFGTLTMVDSYKQWVTYNKKYPTRYPEEVRNFIRDIEEELTGGTCACDDKESALREFEAFIQAFPHSKITTRIHERINQIHQGKSDIREHCINN